MFVRSFLKALGMVPAITLAKLGRPSPLFCQWELTSHCNMKCQFCSNWINPSAWKPNTTTDEALRIIDTLAEMGTRIIHFSGGEPTLRRDLPALISRAKERRLLVAITTNGWVEEARMKGLLLADLVRVSIDGPEDFHNRIRNCSGSFEKAIYTIKLLKSHGKKPLITSIYTKATSFDMLKELASLAESLALQISFSPCKVNCSFIENPSRSDANLNKNRLKIIECDVRDYIIDMKKLKKSFPDTLVNLQFYINVLESGGLDKYGCRAMDISISLKPNGGISMPCNEYPAKVIKGNPRDIFYGPEAKTVRNLQGKYWFCKNCTIRCMSSASALFKLSGLSSIFLSHFKSIS